jgi:hypothetical protein
MYVPTIFVVGGDSLSHLVKEAYTALCQGCRDWSVIHVHAYGLGLPAVEGEVTQ